MDAAPDARGVARIDRREVAALALIVVVAALLRVMDLGTRGTWDADQGTDMTVLHALVTDGRIPLLGPRTSIGDFHHGVLYYYLLAPAALLTRADPLAAVSTIAMAGIAAVAVLWWLARSIGGPVAGLVAAGAMAVSSSAIEESTFIWNPNFIALSSAVALAAAWRAWSGASAGWWVVAGVAQAVTMHCHVLGSVLVVPLAALLVADARRRRGRGRRAVALAGLAAAGMIALSYGPLLVHELGSGFSETRAALDFLGGGAARADAPPLAVRLAVVPLRVLSWPLTGLITDQPIAGLVAAAAVVAILAWRIGRASEPERRAAVWFAATLGWSSVALAAGASSLASVVPGLPNDHYHAFLDPVVFAVVGLGVAALWPSGAAGRVGSGLAMVALVALNVAIWPPRVAPDGGYPAAERAAARILATLDGAPYRLTGLPTLKNTNAYGFPLRRLGGRVADSTAEGLAVPAPVIVACDRLLEPITGAPCGGPAEDPHVRGLEGVADLRLVERWDASPRTVISIYR